MAGVVEWRCERCGGSAGGDPPMLCARCNRVVCPACIPFWQSILPSKRPVCKDCRDGIGRDDTAPETAAKT